jgi:hypothetical protein
MVGCYLHKQDTIIKKKPAFRAVNQPLFSVLLYDSFLPTHLAFQAASRQSTANFPGAWLCLSSYSVVKMNHTKSSLLLDFWRGAQASRL